MTSDNKVSSDVDIDTKRSKSRMLCLPECLAKPSLLSATSTPLALNVGQILPFPHPYGTHTTQFLLNPSGILCELQSFRPSGTKYGSWFVEQKVIGDGLLYVASIVDPKFLLLPVLEKHATRYSPLEQILAAGAQDSPYSYMPLRQCQHLELHRICDVNDQLGEDMILYRFDATKALEWLVQKVQRTQRVLATLESKKGGGGAMAAGFVTAAESNSDHNHDADETWVSAPTRDHLKIAVDIVSEYLQEEWAMKLLGHLGLTVEEMKQQQQDVGTKRCAWDGAPTEEESAMEFTHGKRIKANSNNGGSDTGAGKNSNISAAQKRLAKAATLKGVKSIASFFGKKA